MCLRMRFVDRWLVRLFVRLLACCGRKCLKTVTALEQKAAVIRNNSKICFAVELVRFFLVDRELFRSSLVHDLGVCDILAYNLM